MIRAVVVTTLFLVLGVFLGAGVARASEGTVELTSTTGTPIRCFATSVQMPSLEHRIIVSCRDLIYPPASNMFSYVLWANLIQGGNPAKVGELGFGKAEFSIGPAFSELFVTKEVNGGVNAPTSQNIVMRGNIQIIKLLEQPSEIAQPDEPTQEVKASPSPTPAPKPQENFLLRLGRVTFIVLLAMAAIIGLIFFLIRRK